MRSAPPKSLISAQKLRKSSTGVLSPRFTIVNETPSSWLKELTEGVALTPAAAGTVPELSPPWIGVVTVVVITVRANWRFRIARRQNTSLKNSDFPFALAPLTEAEPKA